MSNLIKNNFDLLRILSNKKNSKINKYIIKSSSDLNLYKAICECVLNVQREIIPLSDSEKVKILKPYKRTINLLSDKRIPLGRKKSVIKKIGPKFLPIILPPVLKYLSFLTSENNAFEENFTPTDE